MDSSKEKIEAQLCAYIEGELDDAERADIERHLQTNPQHKSLMAELRRHRELLQTLPRATVPGELNENLTGQLERSALLSDDDETAEAGVRINRWPQLTAVAAVIILAVGLGIVVYYVLPPAGHHANVAMEANAPQRKAATLPGDADRGALSYGVAPAASQPTGRSAEAEALSDAVSRERKLSNAPAAAATPAPLPGEVPAEAKAVAPTTPLASANDSAALKLRDLTSGPGLVTSGEVEELQKRMAKTLGGEANAAFNLEPRSSLYLIVQTPDAVATSGQVAAYFKTNNIQYMNYEGPPIDLGAPADLPAKLTVVADTDSDVAKGGALGGGVSSTTPRGGRSAVVRAETADRGRGFGGYGGGGGAFGGGGSASGARPQASAAEARRGAEPAAIATESLAQKQESANRSAASGTVAQTQPDYERLYRRGLARGEDLAAGAPTSRPSVTLGAEAGAKAKTDGSVVALGDQSATIVKDELSLAGRQAGGAPQPTNPEAGQNAQGPQTLGRGRFVPGDANWNMRLGGPDANAARGGVIVARMNRRQASELEVALSREQGQRAELRDFGSIAGGTAGTPVVGKPAAAVAEGASAGAGTVDKVAGDKAGVEKTGVDKAAVAEKPATATDALRLTPRPADEPVDVVIVVKPGSATPPAAAAKPEVDTTKK